MTKNIEPDFSYDIRGNLSSSLSWADCVQAMHSNNTVQFQVSRQLFQVLELKDPESFSRLSKLYDFNLIKETLYEYLQDKIPPRVSLKNVNINLRGCLPLMAFCGTIQLPFEDLHDLFLLHMIPRRIISHE